MVAQHKLEVVAVATVKMLNIRLVITVANNSALEPMELWQT